MRTDPLILLGMHRSGTTMLTDLLQKAGVFWGKNTGAYSETLFFRKINHQLLNFSHASWDYPMPFTSFLETPDLVDTAIDYLKEQFKSFRFRYHYTGIAGYNRFLTDEKILWGWKDPRTTLTWPLWLKLMPDARFLFIVRNGVDVANSLYVREHSNLASFTNKGLSVRCYSMKGAFQVWDEYFSICFNQLKQYPEVPLKVVKYEDFLENPESVLSDILQFLHLQISPEQIALLCKQVRPERRFAFVEKKELVDFYRTIQTNQWIKYFGYDTIL